MDEIGSALLDFLVLLAVTVGHLARIVWDRLADYPMVRNSLIAAAAIFVLWWLIDGVRNYQKRCITCKGRGAFGSKLSKRLKRPCRSCGGASNHTTIRRRAFNRIRRRAS